MRLQALAHAGSFRIALTRAAEHLIARGYERDPTTHEDVFRRGSLWGSLAGFHPGRCSAAVRLRRRDANDIHIILDVNDRFQMVTAAEQTFWAREVHGLLTAIEGEPEVHGVTSERAPLMMSVGAAIAVMLVITGITAGLGLAAWAVTMKILPRLGFSLQIAAREWWQWTGIGGLFGLAAVAQTFVLKLADVAAEGKKWVRKQKLPPATDGCEGLVYVFNQDYSNTEEFIGDLLQWNPVPLTPIRHVVHPGANNRATAEAMAVRQMLIAGVAVDRASFRWALVRSAEGVAGSVVTQWCEPANRWAEPQPKQPMNVFFLLIFAALMVAGLFIARHGLSRGSVLAATETQRVLHLVVEKKHVDHQNPDTLGEHRVSGRIRETGETADAGVFGADYPDMGRGAEVKVFRRRPGESSFVSTKKYGESRPIMNVFAFSFSWHFLAGLLCILGGAGGAAMLWLRR